MDMETRSIHRVRAIMASPLVLTACASHAGSELLARVHARMQCYGTVFGAADLMRAVPPATPAPFAQRKQLLDTCSTLVALLDDSSATESAEVFYALHQCRIPVLCLVSPESSLPMLRGNDNPLLTIVDCNNAEAAEAGVDSILKPPAHPGIVVVVEGGDGAGKQTQSALLMSRLKGMGHQVRTMDFPHDAAMHGKLIRTLLSGAMGDIKQVNPLLFASLYAQNRFDVSPILKYWISRGYIVVLDRYVEANFGHQASKLPAADRPPLIAALRTFEHEWLGLPAATRVVYLDLPPREASRALNADGTRTNLDMHETAGDDYKQAVRETFLWCASNFDHWRRLACVDGDGNRITKEKLADSLFEAVADELPPL